jgi:hypothetical protein
MSVDYFLYVKEKHNLISIYLKEIVSIYDEIINKTNEEVANDEMYNKEEDIQLFEELKNNYENQLEQSISFCDSLKNVLNTLCKHEYIMDLIDITPEKSNVIEYCKICGFTKE